MSAMKLRKCPECGAEFEPGHRNQVCCTPECQEERERKLLRARKKAARARREIDKASLDYIKATRPVTLDTLTRAPRKPKNTSDVRWRIELRRRAMQNRYGSQCLDLAPDPDRL